MTHVLTNPTYFPRLTFYDVPPQTLCSVRMYLSINILYVPKTGSPCPLPLNHPLSAYAITCLPKLISPPPRLCLYKADFSLSSWKHALYPALLL